MNNIVHGRKLRIHSICVICHRATRVLQMRHTTVTIIILSLRVALSFGTPQSVAMQFDIPLTFIANYCYRRQDIGVEPRSCLAFVNFPDIRQNDTKRRNGYDKTEIPLNVAIVRDQ